MPKPRKDFGLALAKEIKMQDARVMKEIAQRLRLEKAYEVITGDLMTFKNRPWLKEHDAASPDRIKKGP